MQLRMRNKRAGHGMGAGLADMMTMLIITVPLLISAFPSGIIWVILLMLLSGLPKPFSLYAMTFLKWTFIPTILIGWYLNYRYCLKPLFIYLKTYWNG